YTHTNARPANGKGRAPDPARSATCGRGLSISGEAGPTMVEVLHCLPTESGCVLMVTGTPRGAGDAGRRRCEERGWHATLRPDLPFQMPTGLFVTGPKDGEFRAAFGADPDFDFSRCP